MTTAALRPPAHRVSPRAIPYWMVRAAIGWVVLIGAQVVVWALDWPFPPWHPQLLIATGVLAVLHLAVMPRWRYRVHRWELAPDAVYTQTGWWTQESRIAPTSRIQTVDTERGAIGRLFRLVEGHGDDRVRSGPARHRRAGPRDRDGDRSRRDGRRPRRAGRRDLTRRRPRTDGQRPTVPPATRRRHWSQHRSPALRVGPPATRPGAGSPRGMLFVAPAREVLRFVPLLVVLLFAGAPATPVRHGD